MSFFDKRNNTEKHLAALVSDPNNPQENNNPGLSGLSDIGANSAPHLGGGGVPGDRGHLDSQSQKRSIIIGSGLAPNASLPMSGSLVNPSTSINN